MTDTKPPFDVTPMFENRPIDWTATTPESKSIFASRTFWAAILTPVLSWAGAKYGLQLDAETQAAVIAGASAIAGIVLRAVTSEPVHVVKPKE